MHRVEFGEVRRVQALRPLDTDLVELGEVRRIKALIAENAVDGEVLGRLEAAGLVCQGVQHAR